MTTAVENLRLISRAELKKFRKTVYDYYRTSGRDLPWRHTTDPYRIVVSEIMLQQTQVERVVTKYEPFIARFPDFPTLAKAPFADCLREWQGLGYNRRAVALKRLAETVVSACDGILPSSVELLRTLPGLGPATAASVAAFAFNLPTLFIETNIRRVFIHHFFDEHGDTHLPQTPLGSQAKSLGRSPHFPIHDREILPLVGLTLDTSDPREWYYALMDYGAMLGRTVENPNRRSAHYTKQSSFEGSNRQLRSKMLWVILESPSTASSLYRHFPGSNEKEISNNLQQMSMEGLIVKDGKYFRAP